MNFFSKHLPYVIAEIASAHQGRVSSAIKLVRSINKSKADAVKFQIFNTEKLISKKNSNFKNFKKLEIKYEDWEKVFKETKSINKDFIVEAFDIESLKFSLKLKKIKAFKIPATCIHDLKYLKLIRKTKKPLILSVGGAYFNEIKFAYRILNKHSQNLVLMCGFQNFPTKISDMKLSQLVYLKKYFKCDVGYADHTSSNDFNMSICLPVLAVGLGASIIEKHVTLNRKRQGSDYYSALNPNEFINFVKTLKKTKSSIGNTKSWNLNDAEKKYNKFNKRYAVAKFDLKSNSLISKKNICFKRTNLIGVTENNINKIIGKKLKKNKKFDEIILPKELKS